MDASSGERGVRWQRRCALLLAAVGAVLFSIGCFTQWAAVAARPSPVVDASRLTVYWSLFGVKTLSGGGEGSTRHHSWDEALTGLPMECAATADSPRRHVEVSTVANQFRAGVAVCVIGCLFHVCFGVATAVHMLSHNGHPAVARRAAQKQRSRPACSSAFVPALFGICSGAAAIVVLGAFAVAFRVCGSGATLCQFYAQHLSNQGYHARCHALTAPYLLCVSAAASAASVALTIALPKTDFDVVSATDGLDGGDAIRGAGTVDEQMQGLAANPVVAGDGGVGAVPPGDVGGGDDDERPLTGNVQPVEASNAYMLNDLDGSTSGPRARRVAADC